MISVAPGATFEAWAQFATGSTVGVRIRDGAGADFLARTTSGVVEDVAGSGLYRKSNFTAPATAGQYQLVWDDGTSYASEELLVTSSAPAAGLPGFAPVDLTTLAYVKRAVEITGAGSDSLIPDCITAASRAINRRYERELTPKTDGVTRRIRASVRTSGRRRFVDLAPWDLRGTPTSVTLDPGGAAQVLAADVDYTLLPVGGHSLTGTSLLLELARDLNLEGAFTDRFGFVRLDILGNWGAWATGDVPEDVQRACAVTVASWIDRAVAEYVDEDGGEHSPQIRPGAEQSWAIPGKAHSLLVGAGVPRMMSV